MCGGNTPRPTSNGRIAVMFPSASTKSMSTYSLFFHEGQTASHTRAVFRLEDPSTRDAFGKCESIDLRIEYVPSRSADSSGWLVGRWYTIANGAWMQTIWGFDICADCAATASVPATA